MNIHKSPRQIFEEITSTPNAKKILKERFNYAETANNERVPDDTLLELVYELNNFAQLYKYNGKDLVLRVLSFWFFHNNVEHIDNEL